MRTYRITLSVPSGFITPWHSDTLFGHLCWAAERLSTFENVKGASGLIDLFRSIEPPFILSDGFPAGLLPAPVTLKRMFIPKLSEEFDGSVYDLMKKAKKLNYLTATQFLAFQRGDLNTLDNMVDSFISTTTLHNQISRLTNTTAEMGSLYELDEQFAPCGEIHIYAKVKDGFVGDLRLLFETVSLAGFGKKKSSGKGGFCVTDFDLFTGFDGVEKPAGFIVLSHFVPAKKDPTDGAYKTMVKYGKLGEEKVYCGNPFKKPLIMLKPGAVFKTSEVRPWYGRIIDGLAYADASVVQYGLGFAVPVAG